MKLLPWTSNLLEMFGDGKDTALVTTLVAVETTWTGWLWMPFIGCPTMVCGPSEFGEFCNWVLGTMGIMVIYSEFLGNIVLCTRLAIDVPRPRDIGLSFLLINGFCKWNTRMYKMETIKEIKMEEFNRVFSYMITLILYFSVCFIYILSVFVICIIYDIQRQNFKYLNTRKFLVLYASNKLEIDRLASNRYYSISAFLC